MIRNMKKQYLLGSAIVVLTLVFNTSIAFAQYTQDKVVISPVAQTSHRISFWQSIKNLFSYHAVNTLPAAAIISTQPVLSKTASTIVATQKVSDKDISDLEAKFNTINVSVEGKSTILNSTFLSRLIPAKILNNTAVGKAIQDKDRLLADLAKKSPTSVIAFIEKNNLVGKKQTVDTPVTKISLKDLTFSINITDHSATYLDGKVERTLFSDQFKGLSGTYHVSRLSGYQFGNNVVIIEMSALELVGSSHVEGTVFDYVFEKVPTGENEISIDISVKQFDSKKVCQKLQKSIPQQTCNLGLYRDAWGYPIQKNAYQKLGSNKKVSIASEPMFGVKNIFQSFSDLFKIKEVEASDNDPLVPGLVNCRANINVTGYFKAYFEDVALNNNVGYDDPTNGQARRDVACQSLQDISILIKLDQTNVTPDVLFSVDPGNMPSNALAMASAYIGSYSVGPDNGTLHKHIISHQDPTPGLGNFDAFIITNFGPSIEWDVDSTLNTNTYSLSTTLTHEILHALGFRSSLPASISQTNVAHSYDTFDLGLYKDTTLANRFFNTVTNFLQVPIGAPSSWFINNTDVYQGTKNITGVTPDGIRPIYSPNPWEQGSSLSHFDMARAGGQIYVMNPSIGTNTTRNIHNNEKEVLCHEGYRVLGMNGCELPTPVAVDDSIMMSGAQMCLQPLINDSSFAGGNISIQSLTPTTLQVGDTLTYYTSTDCTSGSQTNATNAKSIKIVFGSSTAQRVMQYTIKDSISNRISFPALINLTPLLSCQDTYNYVRQWGVHGPANSLFGGIAVAPSGDIYVADTGNGYMEKFTSTGTFLLDWPIPVTSVMGMGGNIAGVAVGVSGNVYFTTRQTDIPVVQKFNQSGTLISQWQSPFFVPYVSGGQYMGIALDSSENVYVSDVSTHNIEEFTSSGVFVKKFGWGVQDGSNAFQICTSNCQDGILGSGNGQFSFPEGIAIDSSDNIYVVDMGNNRIQKFNSSGVYITQWPVFGGLTAEGIAIDSSDNIFVSTLYDKVQKYDSSGTFITQWGSYGTGDGQFNYLSWGIAVDNLGNVYTGDWNGSRIQVFNTNCDLCSNIPGEQLTVPTGYQAVGGQCIASTSISGKVYYDLNSSGSLNTNESGLDGVQVGLFHPGDITPFQTTTTQNIPNLGKYTFNSVPDGTYYVALIDEDLYSSITQPGTASGLIPGHTYVRTVTISSGQISNNNDFGVVLESCVTPPPDMVSWWTGDTDSTDHFGPNNGHFQGGTTISAGYVDDSFLFDGVNDDIEVFNNPSLTPSTNEFTFDFWMKPTQVTAAPRTLIRKGKTYRITSDGRNINFEVENPTTSVRYISTTTVPLILNQWNFVAVSYSGPNQTMSIYVNGNEIPTTVNTLFTTGFPQTIVHQLNSLYFGADYGMSNYFQGNLDEIEFFDRVLTIAELQSIFDAGSAGKCKPILPDLIVTYFSWQPTNPTVGGYLVVQPTIKNIGTATADVTSGTRFAVYKNSINSSNFVGWLEVGTGAFSLAPGASTTLTSFDLLSNAVDQAGAFNFVINADDTIASMMPDYPPTTNHVIESNENNNSLTRFITIQ